LGENHGLGLSVLGVGRAIVCVVDISIRRCDPSISIVVPPVLPLAQSPGSTVTKVVPVKIVASMAIIRGWGRVLIQESSSRRVDPILAFLMDLPGRVLHAINDRLPVNIKSDRVHNVSRNLLG
jgi:hypothetical protein